MAIFHTILTVIPLCPFTSALGLTHSAFIKHETVYFLLNINLFNVKTQLRFNVYHLFQGLFVNILIWLNTVSRQRRAWWLLLGSVLLLEAGALFFQHVMQLAPCVMCIYERVALFGVGAAALLGVIAPQRTAWRWGGLLAWGASALKGLLLSMQHVNYQLHPSPFERCDLFVTFPDWAPLNQWADWLFEAYGDCSDIVWQWLSLSMPQWLTIIFAAYLVVLVLVVIAQWTKPRL